VARDRDDVAGHACSREGDGEGGLSPSGRGEPFHRSGWPLRDHCFNGQIKTRSAVSSKPVDHCCDKIIVIVQPTPEKCFRCVLVQFCKKLTFPLFTQSHYTQPVRMRGTPSSTAPTTPKATATGPRPPPRRPRQRRNNATLRPTRQRNYFPVRGRRGQRQRALPTIQFILPEEGDTNEA
jgi:hypothetical protein